MDAQAEQIKRAAPVWIWDGHWWPAVVADATRGGFQIFQVGGAVLTGRRPHRNKNHLRLRDGFRVLGGEGKIVPGAGHQLRQVRLIKGNLAGLERFHFAFVGIDAGYFVPQKSQARSSGQTHISSSNDRDIHKG